MKLAPNVHDQVELERILEETKPPVPVGARGRHFLISTPFRYPPLPHGSRFGRPTERGLFYASRELHTTLGETAYYRLVFAQGTEADLYPLVSRHTAFKVQYNAQRGIDLTVAPFAAHQEQLTSANDYSTCQTLGTAMRADGVTLIRFASARVAGGINVAALVPEVITSNEPIEPHSWQLLTTENGVRAIHQHLGSHTTYAFDCSAFLINGQLPAPAV